MEALYSMQRHLQKYSNFGTLYLPLKQTKKLEYGHWQMLMSTR